MDLMDLLLFNLKVIGKLSEHNTDQFKLNVCSGEAKIEELGFFSALKRSLNGESRTKSVEYLTKTYQTCHQLMHMYLTSTFLTVDGKVTNYQFNKATDILIALKSLSKELEVSICGLKAFKKSYEKDTSIGAKIDLLVVKANRMILNIHSAIEQAQTNLNVIVSTATTEVDDLKEEDE